VLNHFIARLSLVRNGIKCDTRLCIHRNWSLLLQSAGIKGGILYKCFLIKLLTHVFEHRDTILVVKKD
jgi:hypothetical protein